VRQTQVFGPHLELRRTLSGTLGEAVIRIEDEVTNRGNAPAPHMLLYHVNFGWPLADEGADVRWRGAWQSPGEKTEPAFSGKATRSAVPGAPGGPRGRRRRSGLHRHYPRRNGRCVAGLHNPRLGIAVALRFRKDQLPWLINWQHWGRANT
jgi:hypothetical protein